MATLTPEDLFRADELRHASDEARAEYIRELIIGLRWEAPTARKLAEHWAVGAPEMSRLGRLARGLIAAALEDPDAIRKEILAKVHYVVTDAMAAKKAMLDKTGEVILVPQPNHVAALKGLELLARVAGVDQPKQVEPEREYDKKTLAELLELAAKALPPKHPPFVETARTEKARVEFVDTTGVGDE